MVAHAGLSDQLVNPATLLRLDAEKDRPGTLDRNRPYLLTGHVEENWGAATLTVERSERVGVKPEGRTVQIGERPAPRIGSANRF